MVRFIEAEANKTGRGEQFWLKDSVVTANAGFGDGLVFGPEGNEGSDAENLHFEKLADSLNEQGVVDRRRFG